MDSVKPSGVAFPIHTMRFSPGGEVHSVQWDDAAAMARGMLTCSHEDPLTMRGTYDPSWRYESATVGGPEQGQFVAMGCRLCMAWVIAAGPAFAGDGRLVPKVEGGG